MTYTFIGGPSIVEVDQVASWILVWRREDLESWGIGARVDLDNFVSRSGATVHHAVFTGSNDTLETSDVANEWRSGFASRRVRDLVLLDFSCLVVEDSHLGCDEILIPQCETVWTCVSITDDTSRCESVVECETSWITGAVELGGQNACLRDRRG